MTPLAFNGKIIAVDPGGVTVKSLANRIGVSPETIRKYRVRHGMPRPIKQGRDHIIPAAPLAQWLGTHGAFVVGITA